MTLPGAYVHARLRASERARRPRSSCSPETGLISLSGTPSRFGEVLLRLEHLLAEHELALRRRCRQRLGLVGRRRRSVLRLVDDVDLPVRAQRDLVARRDDVEVGHARLRAADAAVAPVDGADRCRPGSFLGDLQVGRERVDREPRDAALRRRSAAADGPWPGTKRMSCAQAAKAARIAATATESRRHLSPRGIFVNSSNMPHAIRIHENGGPEVLRFETVDREPLGARQVRIRQTAIGVNFIDTYDRSGLYPVSLPSGLGREAAGVVLEAGKGVKTLRVGDRVAYAGNTPGRVLRRARDGRGARREAAGLSLRSRRRRADAEGAHGLVPAAALPPRAAQRAGAAARGGGRRRPDRAAVGGGARREGHRGGRQRREGGARRASTAPRR